MPKSIFAAIYRFFNYYFVLDKSTDVEIFYDGAPGPLNDINDYVPPKKPAPFSINDSMFDDLDEPSSAITRAHISIFCSLFEKSDQATKRDFRNEFNRFYSGIDTSTVNDLFALAKADGVIEWRRAVGKWCVIYYTA